MRKSIGARVGAALGIVIALGCGGDTTEPKPGDDGDQANGLDEAGQTRKSELSVDAGHVEDAAPPAPTCPEDDPTTPGVECAGMVSCGGTADRPTLCPTDTHSCCVAGYPSEDTVSCEEGVDSCVDALASPCDGPDDCGDGEVCCLFRTAGFVTKCAPQAECGSADLVQCHRDEDCPLGLACLANPNVPWWGGCK